MSDLVDHLRALGEAELIHASGLRTVEIPKFLWGPVCDVIDETIRWVAAAETNSESGAPDYVFNALDRLFELTDKTKHESP